MKRLMKVNKPPASAKHVKSNDGFVFSDDIAKWMSSSSPTTNDRRRRHKEFVNKPQL